MFATVAVVIRGRQASGTRALALVPCSVDRGGQTLVAVGSWLRGKYRVRLIVWSSARSPGSVRWLGAPGAAGRRTRDARVGVRSDAGKPCALRLVSPAGTFCKTVVAEDSKKNPAEIEQIKVSIKRAGLGLKVNIGAGVRRCRELKGYWTGAG